MEGQIGLVEELAPTAFKHREKALVDFDIVGVGFPLIPKHTAHVVALKRLDGALEEIGRFVGVALALRSGLLCVIGGAFAGPAHDEIVVFPVAENGWKFLFERLRGQSSFPCKNRPLRWKSVRRGSPNCRQACVRS